MSKPKLKKARGKSPASARPERRSELISLENLHFDTHNPRFGPDAQDLKTETLILDRIVNVHGVGDLLSSLAVNGYSDAEPLIGLRDADGSIIVKEGNRRLAACLILANDPRAENQVKRIERYGAIRRKHGNKPVDPVPVIVFEQSEIELILPYLGVKHIVGAEEWSAWAKAAWADELLSTHNVSLETAVSMIGDEQGLLLRFLGSYYFVQQLIAEGRFNPSDSEKRGGSGSEFPFSLIYNALGYKNIKRWVGFTSEQEPKRNPIPKSKLDAATELMDFICGNKSKGIAPKVRDNREFSYLNQIVENEEALTSVRQGIPLDKAALRLEPAPNRLMDGLVRVKAQLQELVTLAAQEQLDSASLSTLLPPCKSVMLLAKRLYQHLQDSGEASLFAEPVEERAIKSQKAEK